jgi:hypothetical protein
VKRPPSEPPAGAAVTPRTEYTRRLQARRQAGAEAARREVLVGNARVVVFLACAALAWFVFGPAKLAAWWLAPPVVLFVGLLIVYERVKRTCRRAERAVAFYERGLARLDDQWPGTGKAGSGYLDGNHPYAADLDLFGQGSLFELLCTARTRSGEDTLAAWLRSPAAAEVVWARQGAVADLRNRLDLREEFALLGADVAPTADLEALARWGAAPPVGLPRWARVGAVCFATLQLAGIAAWFTLNFGLIPFVLAALLAGGFALWLRVPVGRVLATVERRAHDLALLSGVLHRIEREPFAAERLRQLQQDLQTAGLPPSRRIAQLVQLIDRLDWKRNFFFAPLAYLLLWDTHIALSVEAWRATSRPAIARWLSVVGEFEALCALAAYAYEHPADPFPEIVADGPCFEGEGLGHPLIPEARCVRNDVQLGNEVRLLVVSGSNMSGKSTLLRTVGVNVVLALAGAPVRGHRLRLSPLMVGATLRIQDSLQAGRSRFFAEITRVRQLVDLAKGSPPLLFLLDELFHGTNSRDRCLGAEGVTRGLIDCGALGLITTHDLALAAIADRLGPRARNVHFEDHLENGTMVFDYRMRPGVVQKSNALALMRAVGLDV